MITNDINNLFACNEMKNILIKIAKEDDLRMCLNKDVIDRFIEFFSDIIMFSFVVDILPSDLQKIYLNPETYLQTKLGEKLKVDASKNKAEVEKYLNKILGKKKYIFHGTTSNMKHFFTNKNVKNENRINIGPVKTIDKIYQKHGVYKIFESGIRDYNENNFFVASSIKSACFYALQSPEYFARFASRSDYYKQDIFKYDRIAYYRKDYKACKNNLKKEMEEFGFNNHEKQTVLKNFDLLWNNVVFKDMKNIILFNEIEENNINHFSGKETVYDMLLKYFEKLHFKYDFDKFVNGFKEIVLPDIKLFLKRQKPIINKKFVVVDNKKYAPDFYIDCKYSNHLYFTLNRDVPLIYIDKNIKSNDYFNLILLSNEAVANSKQANKFIKQNLLSVQEVLDYYKKEFEHLLKKLERTKELAKKAEITQEICENVGLKYVVLLKYNKYFKDVSNFLIRCCRICLGVKLFEHYDGKTEITSEKIANLTNFYKEILTNEASLKQIDFRLKVENLDYVR